MLASADTRNIGYWCIGCSASLKITHNTWPSTVFQKGCLSKTRNTTFAYLGDAATAQAFIDKLKIFSLLANVADVKSLVIHPASTTHSQLSPDELLDQGIKPNTIRLSVGTEFIGDILDDLSQAFT